MMPLALIGFFIFPSFGIPETDSFVSTSVTRSLEASLSAAAPRDGRALAAETARLLRWRGDINRLVRRGDRVTLLYHEAEAAPGRPRLPEITALQYQGALMTLEAYLFTDLDGVPRYFDAAGLRIEPVMLHPPVPHYAQISETVQRGRGKRRHRGDDFKAALGSDVILPFSGRVSRINWGRRRNGLCVEVALDAGYTAHFLHLLSLAPGLHVGKQLAAGAPIGQVGNSGHSSGPHLHYELLRKQVPAEPLRVHGRAVGRLIPSQLDAFERLKLRLGTRIRGASLRREP